MGILYRVFCVTCEPSHVNTRHIPQSRTLLCSGTLCTHHRIVSNTPRTILRRIAILYRGAQPNSQPHGTSMAQHFTSLFLRGGVAVRGQQPTGVSHQSHPPESPVTQNGAEVRRLEAPMISLKIRIFLTAPVTLSTPPVSSFQILFSPGGNPLLLLVHFCQTQE